MERSGKLSLIMKVFSIMLLTLSIISLSGVADAEWHFGLGTGISGLNIDGDLGFHSTLAGPVKVNVELDPDDISDLMSSAIGFGGYAANGNWMIQYSFGGMDLKGAGSSSADGISVAANIGFDVTKGEMTVAYSFYESASVILKGLGGFRYTKHELTSATTISDALDTVSFSRDIDQDWVDFLAGFVVDVPFARTWNWSSRFDAGFGGSEGTYSGSTGLTWRFYKGWSGTLFANYAAVDYENNDRNASDWYLYDIDETTFGLTILYNW